MNQIRTVANNLHQYIMPRDRGILTSEAAENLGISMV